MITNDGSDYMLKKDVERLLAYKEIEVIKEIQDRYYEKHKGYINFDTMSILADLTDKAKEKLKEQ